MFKPRCTCTLQFTKVPVDQKLIQSFFHSQETEFSLLASGSVILRETNTIPWGTGSEKDCGLHFLMQISDKVEMKYLISM